VEILPERVVRVKSMSDYQRLWVTGDWHLMNRSCIERMVDEHLEEIAKDKHSLVLAIGDYADLITAYDPRFDAHDVAPGHREKFFEKLGSQIIDMLIEKFTPIRKQVVAVLRGNHEDKFENKMDQAIIKDVCAKLDMPYGDYCCAFDLTFTTGKKSETFRVWAHHGSGNAQTIGGKINKLKRSVNIFDADIYAQGHMHDQMDVSRVRLYDDNGVIRQKKQLCVATGSFLATYRQGASSYAEKKMYEPVALGPVAIRIRPKGRKLALEKY
jgi:hypothetical protein